MTKNSNRFIGRFIIEAETPVIVGSGASSLVRDALAAQDANGLPFIPGTTLAGVLRHAFSILNPNHPQLNTLFGNGGEHASGSQLITSGAYLMLNETHCAEGILDENDISEQTLLKFSQLPKRQHVRINAAGVAVNKGLFDNEVVYKGTRFMFELELRDSELSTWNNLVETLQSPLFRLGGGTRKGYGRFKVLKAFTRAFDLAKDANDFEAYLNHNPSLNAQAQLYEVFPKPIIQAMVKEYSLTLRPDSFFIFGQGHGDNTLDTDHKPLEEEIVIYGASGIVFKKQTVIPGSSIKGALAHRVAYHYNKLTGVCLNNLHPSQYVNHIGENNTAVRELFGTPAGIDAEPQAGNIVIDDLFLSDQEVDNSKILNHVAIDRFTGGAIEGALFSENVSRLQTDAIHFKIYVVNTSKYSEHVIQAFEDSLSDLCMGLLPLGGMTTKGFGAFTGNYTLTPSN